MLLIDILSNVDRSDENVAPISPVVLCRAAGIRSDIQYDWRKQTSIKAYWLAKLRESSGRYYGQKAIYLSDNPVGLSGTNAIHKEAITWLDKDAYNKVYTYISDIILRDESLHIHAFPKFGSGMEKDIIPTYSVYNLNELVDWGHAMYHGEPCEIERDSNRKHWPDEDLNDQYVTIWINKTTLRVHISELEFCYHLKSSNHHE